MYYKLPGMRLQNGGRVFDLHGGGDLPINPHGAQANPDRFWIRRAISSRRVRVLGPKAPRVSRPTARSRHGQRWTRTCAFSFFRQAGRRRVEWQRWRK